MNGPVSPTNRAARHQPGSGRERVEWAVSLLDDSLGGFERSLAEEARELQWKLREYRKSHTREHLQAPQDQPRWVRRLHVRLAVVQRLQSEDALVDGSEKAKLFALWQAPEYLHLTGLNERGWFHTALAVVYRSAMTLVFSIVPFGAIWIVVLLAAFVFTHP